MNEIPDDYGRREWPNTSAELERMLIANLRRKRAANLTAAASAAPEVPAS